jgi:hypothetical protein
MVFGEREGGHTTLPTMRWLFLALVAAIHIAMNEKVTHSILGSGMLPRSSLVGRDGIAIFSLSHDY